MVDQLFDTAAANGFHVVRMWGFDDVYSPTYLYFQYWGGSSPQYNDGSDGLQHLDYAVYSAKQRGIRVIIPFVNNWKDYGGIPQYIQWRGASHHDDFYTDNTIIQWYKNYVSHVLNRVNIYTNVAYKDEAAILGWELANEPRCSGETYSNSGSCTPQTIANWISNVASFIKSIDGNHLLGVGDEGFYSGGDSSDWTANGSEGDCQLYASQPGIDYVSYHLYPDSWGKDSSWGTSYINTHLDIGRNIGKPAVLGEYGLRDKSQRDNVYTQWTQAVQNGGGQGDLFWMLASYQDDGNLYPDYDGFTVYCPSSTCSLLTQHAANMGG